MTRTLVRVALVALALLALWLLARDLPLLHFLAVGAQRAQAAGPLGVVGVLAAVYLLALCFAPVPPLVVACGWIYGSWGVLVALVAITGSAATGFSLSRALGRSAFAKALLERPRLRALAELVERGGLLTVALVRVSPLLPFTPSNAVMGLTGLPLRTLVLGTFLGLAPAAALYAWAGSLLPSADALERGEGLHLPPSWPLIALGVFGTILLGAAAARRLRPARPS